MQEANDDEIAALFQNPQINSNFLGDLYAREGAFDGLEEGRWRRLIAASTGNPRLKTEYSGSMDGWAEYVHGRVFDQAWSLAARVPVSEEWADILSRLLEDTLPLCFSMKDRIAVIDRWREPDRTALGQAALGYEDAFGYVRMWLTRLWFEWELEQFKDHDDIALRCGYYRRGRLDAEGLRAAFAKDSKFVLDCALDNENVWRDRQTREALRKLCWGVDRPQDELEYPNYFEGAEGRFRDKHPEWFVDEVENGKTDPFKDLTRQIQELQEALLAASARSQRLLVLLCYK